MMRLWKDTDLVAYIKRQAARHFSCKQDQEDAASAAWERLEKLKYLPSPGAIQRLAYNAIIAMYRREHRRRGHECSQPTE